MATGHARLDAELPGGGWPLGAMTELLQPMADGAVWSLLLPALAAHWQASGETVVLVRPPHEPFIPALSAAGLPAQAVLWVRAETATAALWAAEQALRCADVGSVVTWLPGARTADLRRLQGAAARRAGSLLFVLRPEGAAASASPARLRAAVRVARAREGAASRLQINILKRRGPPLAAPLFLDAQGGQMQALLAAASAQYHFPDNTAETAGAAVLPFATQRESSYALDRLAVAA